jgi:hypothetical protein
MHHNQLPEMNADAYWSISRSPIVFSMCSKWSRTWFVDSPTLLPVAFALGES